MHLLRKHSSDGDQPLRMTPMIDVVFLLLVFFLIGTTFRQPAGEMKAHLPKEEDGGEPAAARPDPIYLMLRPGARAGGPPVIRLGGVAGRSFRWLDGRLARRLGALAADTSVPVVIDADRRLHYHWVVKAIDACRRAGFGRVAFAARRTRPAQES